MNATAYRQPAAPKAKNTALIVLIAILVIVVAVYTGIWLVLKNRTENALAKIQPQLPIDFTYTVGGYPFHHTVTLHDLTIPINAQEAAIYQSFGFTPARTEGVQLRAKGDTVFSMNLFGSSAVVKLPQEFTDESGKEPVHYTFDSPAKIELGYSTPNAAIFANMLTGAPTPQGKELISRFRSLSYKDTGAKMAKADGTVLAEWKNYSFEIQGKPVGADLEATLSFGVEDLATSSGYYAFYLNNLGEFSGAAVLFRDFASYIADYPYYELPVSANLDLYAKVPMDMDKDKPFQGQFALTRLSVHDKNGESIQSGNLTVNRTEGALAEAYGDFTWKAQNFPHSLSRYAGLVGSLLQMADARRTEIAALSGKPVNLPPAQDSMALVAVVEKQIKEFLIGLGALKDNDLFLTIEKKQGGALTVNGKSEAEVQQLFQQHASPALQVFGAMQQQPR
ncbi:MAG: hypothetical protein FJX23_02275 [Alphaproteobacteria bacterium]|nr:hypothetical protein [Alphaproteobacteria bacterium]